MLVPIVVMAVATANMALWNLNFRYIPYEIPAALILLAAWSWPLRKAAMTLCAALTIAQALPLKLAYFDENSASHSTRLAAAAWIDAHIPSSDAICAASNTLGAVRRAAVPIRPAPDQYARLPLGGAY